MKPGSNQNNFNAQRGQNQNSAVKYKNQTMNTLQNLQLAQSNLRNEIEKILHSSKTPKKQTEPQIKVAKIQLTRTNDSPGVVIQSPIERINKNEGSLMSYSQEGYSSKFSKKNRPTSTSLQKIKVNHGKTNKSSQNILFLTPKTSKDKETDSPSSFVPRNSENIAESKKDNQKFSMFSKMKPQNQELSESTVSEKPFTKPSPSPFLAFQNKNPNSQLENDPIDPTSHENDLIAPTLHENDQIDHILQNIKPINLSFSPHKNINQASPVKPQGEVESSGLRPKFDLDLKNHIVTNPEDFDLPQVKKSSSSPRLLEKLPSLRRKSSREETIDIGQMIRSGPLQDFVSQKPKSFRNEDLLDPENHFLTQMLEMKLLRKESTSSISVEANVEDVEKCLEDIRNELDTHKRNSIEKECFLKIHDRSGFDSDAGESASKTKGDLESGRFEGSEDWKNKEGEETLREVANDLSERNQHAVMNEGSEKNEANRESEEDKDRQIEEMMVEERPSAERKELKIEDEKNGENGKVRDEENKDKANEIIIVEEMRATNKNSEKLEEKAKLPINNDKTKPSLTAERLSLQKPFKKPESSTNKTKKKPKQGSDKNEVINLRAKAKNLEDNKKDRLSNLNKNQSNEKVEKIISPFDSKKEENLHFQKNSEMFSNKKSDLLKEIYTIDQEIESLNKEKAALEKRKKQELLPKPVKGGEKNLKIAEKKEQAIEKDQKRNQECTFRPKTAPQKEKIPSLKEIGKKPEKLHEIIRDFTDITSFHSANVINDHNPKPRDSNKSKNKTAMKPANEKVKEMYAKFQKSRNDKKQEKREVKKEVSLEKKGKNVRNQAKSAEKEINQEIKDILNIFKSASKVLNSSSQNFETGK